jgi:hypothetical protein
MDEQNAQGDFLMYNAIMLDLETFGTRPNAAIVQLGIQPFNSLTGEFDRKDGRKWDVALDSCLDAGGSVDQSTISWWVRNSAKMPTGDGVYIGPVLEEVTRWLLASMPKKFTVWSQGANFDIPIVDGYYGRLKLRSAWNPTAARDTRTVYELARERGWEKAPGETSHDALEDCWKQIEDLSDALKVIRQQK